MKSKFTYKNNIIIFSWTFHNYEIMNLFNIAYNMNLFFNVSIYESGPQNPEFIYKKSCIYSYTFKLQSLAKYSPFDEI